MTKLSNKEIDPPKFMKYCTLCDKLFQFPLQSVLPNRITCQHVYLWYMILWQLEVIIIIIMDGSSVAPSTDDVRLRALSHFITHSINQRWFLLGGNVPVTVSLHEARVSTLHGWHKSTTVIWEKGYHWSLHHNHWLQNCYLFRPQMTFDLARRWVQVFMHGQLNTRHT